jgi:hypothetical protein
MNYLDILDDDLLNKIFDILADLYESEILIANNKLLKVKKLVSGLTIDADPEYYSVNYISYYNITYYIDNYLYSKYHLDNIIIIYRLKLIVNYLNKTLFLNELEKYYQFFKDLPNLHIVIITNSLFNFELIFLLQSYKFPIKKN